MRFDYIVCDAALVKLWSLNLGLHFQNVAYVVAGYMAFFPWLVFLQVLELQQCLKAWLF